MSSRRCRETCLQTVTTGALFVASGMVVWGGARGWYSLRDVWVWWPLAFVFPALHALTAPPPMRSIFGGFAWLGLAAVLIAANLGHLQLRFEFVLSILCLIAGARLLYVAWQRRRTS